MNDKAERQRIIRMAEEQCLLHQIEGRWHFDGLTSANLRAIASELDRRNGIIQQGMEEFDYKP